MLSLSVLLWLCSCVFGLCLVTNAGPSATALGSSRRTLPLQPGLRWGLQFQGTNHNSRHWKPFKADKPSVTSRQIHVSVLAGPGCFGSARCWLPGMATCDFQGETFPSFWRLSQAKPLKRLVSTPTVTALRDLPFLAAFANVTGIKNNGRNPRTGIASSLAKTGRGPSSAARAHGRSKEQPPAHHKAPRGQALGVPYGFSCLPKGPGSQG